MSNKELLTLEEVKAMIVKDVEIMHDFRAFKQSDLAKAIKKKKIKPEGISHVFTNCDEYPIREYCLRHGNFTYADAARYGLVRPLEWESEWTEFFINSKGFFTSVEEFVDLVKELYGIDLNEDTSMVDLQRDHADFKSFVTGLMFTNARNYYLDRKRFKDADVYKEFCMESFPYFVKMYHIYESINQGAVATMSVTLENLSNGKLWVVNYPMFKELIDKHVYSSHKNMDKVKILMKASSLGFVSSERRAYPFKDRKEFFTMLEDIRALDPNFPFMTQGHSYGQDDAIRKFQYGLYCFMVESDIDAKLTREEKDYLYDIVVTELIKPENKVALRRAYHDNLMLKAMYNVAPLDKLDDVYDAVKGTYTTQKAIERAISLGETNKNFYPTLHITDEMMRNYLYCSWENIIFPEDKMYDLEFIKFVTMKLGKRGVIFGKEYGGNPFFTQRVDFTKMPAEFFQIYADHLEWYNISYCMNLDLDFIKKHRNELNFNNLRYSVSEQIDEELGEWLMKQSENGDCYDNVVRQSKNLGPAFIAKYAERVWSYNNGRDIKAAKVSVKLAEVVKELA